MQSAQSLCVETLPATVYAYRFSRRKREILRSFLPGRVVRAASRGSHVPAGGCLLLWGSTELPADAPADVRVVRVEDGFLRSVGLGADLVRPLSWVFDGRGIYYDATCPSDLEVILNTAPMDVAMVARAADLRARAAASALTKYNVGSGSWARPDGCRRVILVPGQVETDASIRTGAPDVRTNMGLLRAAREANPDAHVLYKTHPDVVAGLRALGEHEAEARRWCDEVVSDVPMGDLLPRVDEVHTLTSLAGFEGLLRGRAVTCYGRPFYSGWGLTTDMVPPPPDRRQRRLTLDELVAGALILYPTYVSRADGRRTTPEQALEELLAWRDAAGEGMTFRQRAARTVIRAIGWLEGRR